MNAPVNGYIHSVESAGAVDGPGLRFVVFLSGCPLRCLYCHNPDTRHLKDGTVKSSAELASEVALYKDYLIRAKGGVTLSGGDPLMQQEFATDFFRRCKAEGLHTALDTSGYLGRKASDALLDVTDLVLLDIKHFHSATYKRITGVDLAPTLDFAAKLNELKKPTWIRYVLVPGLTDDVGAVTDLARYIAPMENVSRVEVLPFHKMGEDKWKRMGFAYELGDTPEPSTEQAESVRKIFQDQFRFAHTDKVVV